MSFFDGIFEGISNLVDGDTVTHSFILRRARRKVNDFFVKQKIDEARVRMVIEKDIPLSFFIPQGNEAKVRQETAKYAKLVVDYSDEELASLLPPWALETITSYGDQGNAWLVREVGYMRSMFAEEAQGDDEGSQPLGSDQNQGGSGGNKPDQTFLYRPRV